MYSDITVPAFVVRTRKVHTISSYLLKYILIEFVYNNGLWEGKDRNPDLPRAEVGTKSIIALW
jgi:hypothetical protein